MKAPLSVRFAARELRAGVRGFRIFLACLALGVAAIAAASSLDGKNAAVVADMMFDLVAETGAAMVLVTHDPALAARADRSVRMADGRFV